MALSTYSAVLFAIACFLTSGSASAPLRGTSNTPERGNLEPTWRVDLTSVVGSASLGKVFGRTREYQGLPQASLWFTSNETLVATFVTREGQPELPVEMVWRQPLGRELRFPLLKCSLFKAIVRGFSFRAC